MQNDNLSILVLSCDKYSDLWPPFFQCFLKFWPDCEYPIYLGANKKIFANDKVKTLLTGDDKDWSSSLRKIINQINSDYIFIILEDLFLVKEVNNQKFKESFNILVKNNFNHCHVSTLIKPDYLLNNDVGVYEKGIPYRVNVLGLWRKDYLSKIIIDGENPWNFEIMGSYRSSYDDGFFCLLGENFKTINAVEKGRWYPDKLKIAEEFGLELDRSRPVLKGVYLLKSNLQKIIVKLIILMPWKQRVKLMNMLRKILFSY
jgi:hypothetical protein